MPDIAELGIAMDTRQLVEGTKALDTLGDVAARTDQKTRSLNGQMDDTVKVMRAQAEQSRANAQAATALGGSTTQLTLGQQQLIERMREQAATIGMSRTQLLAYQAAQMGVTKETQDAIAKIKGYEDAIRAAAKAKEEAANSTSFLTSAVKGLAAAYAALKIADYVKESALLASRYETLGVVMEVVGRNAGYTKTQMLTATQAIAAQGITMVESRESAVKLVQAHVDLKNATVLARIAQDAAVIGHLNSSDAFDRLVNGISRGNVLILRNIGINVNLQSAYRQMADELGKTTKELTENERVQARLNAVIERGSDIAGTYAASMDTAGKQITSMQRYVTDLKTQFGETFNEVLTISVMALTRSLKDANGEVSALSKNNSLEDWGHNLASTFVWLANTVNNASTVLQKAWAWADFKQAQGKIIDQYQEKIDANESDSSIGSDERKRRYDRLMAWGASELAQSKADYAAQQSNLTADFDRFEKAEDARNAARTAKRKAEADAQLKVDADYAKAASDILLQSANAGAAAQEVARKKVIELYNKTYVGSPTYRDSEAPEPKAKVDRAENTRLTAQIEAYEREISETRAHYAALGKLDDLYLRAGELSAEQAYKNKRQYAEETYAAEVDAYQLELDALRGHKSATEAEEERHQKEIKAILGKLGAAEKAFFDERKLRDEEERLRKAGIVAASDEASGKYIFALNQEAKKIEEANRGREESRGAIEREAVAQLDLAIAYQKQFMAGQEAAGATAEEIAQAPAILKYLEDQRAARLRLAQGLDAQSDAKHMENLANQAIKDWERAGNSIADSLSSAFGTGGKAIGQMFKAYSEGVAGQLRAQKELREAKKLSDDNPEKIGAINRAQLSGATAQIKSYADMTTAAQGFFNEGSRGYQAMAAASQVMHAAEVALTLVKGVNAVLTQGEGDPYTAFGRMAAMAAIVAGLGVAIGGGGGGSASLSEERRASVGAGTILGDSKAKSDSIAKSLQLVEDNTYRGMLISSSMLASLRNIESSILGLGNLLVRTGAGNAAADGVNTGTTINAMQNAKYGAMVGSFFGPIGSAIGLVIGGVLGALSGVLAKVPVIGGVVSKLFGTSTSVQDSGFTADKIRLDQVAEGRFQALAYADVQSKSKFLGITTGTSTSTQTKELDAQISKQFSLVIMGIGKSITAAADVLGASGSEFEARLGAFVVDIGKITTKGLTGEEVQKSLEAAFAKLGDQMAETALGDLLEFQGVGEGTYATLVRLANEYATVDAVLGSFGKSFGQVGVESIKAREHLIELSGGLEKFTSQGGYFLENFFTNQEKADTLRKSVDAVLTPLNQGSAVTSIEQFKKLALAQDLSTDAGAKTYASMMAVAQAFVELTRYGDEFGVVTKTADEILSERKDLQQQLNEITMTTLQLLALERETYDASNRALFDQIQAAKAVVSAKDALSKAYETEAAAGKAALDKSKAWVTTLNGLNASFALGNQSTLMPEQKYAEARAQFEKTLAAAIAGDTTAQSGLSAAEQAFLAASQVVNASDAKYAADYARVMAANEEAMRWAKIEVDVQQASLDALKAQVSGLITINDSVLTVAQAIAKLQAAMGVSDGLGVHFSNAPAFEAPAAPAAFDAMRYSAAANVGSDALVAEIRGLREDNKAMRDELKGLREDQARQASDTIRANQDANADAAKTVVSGVEKSAKASAWERKVEFSK